MSTFTLITSDFNKLFPYHATSKLDKKMLVQQIQIELWHHIFFSILLLEIYMTITLKENSLQIRNV